MREDQHRPFSRPVPVHDVPAAGQPFRIEARPDEREALARDLDIVALDSLRAEGLLLPESAGRRVKLVGRLVARVVQTCVVTLEPVAADIDTAFERLFGLDASGEWDDAQGAGEVFLDLSLELPPDPLPGGVADLGAAAAEQLALELDPYPRAQGAVFAPPADSSAAESAAAGGEADNDWVGTLSRWRKGNQG